MTLKRKIFYSNLLMVIIPLVITLILGGGFARYIQKNYVDSVIQNQTLTENTYIVHDLVNEIDFDSFTDQTAFENLISSYDYQFIYKVNGTTLFSNLAPIEENKLKVVDEMNDHMIIYKTEDSTIISKRITLNQNTYEIDAVQTFTLTEAFSDVSTILLYIFLVFLIPITGIILINLILTNKLIKGIMVPIHQLSDGVELIEEGNLSTKIEYYGYEEFTKLCQSFDLMRNRLKKNIEKNIKYEDRRKEMVAGLSHDLKTPLTSIKGYVKGLIDGVATSKDKELKYLEIIYEKANSMEKLLNQLTLFSKLDTKSIPFYFQKTNINGYIQQFLINNQKDYEQKGVEILYNSSCSHEQVLMDMDQMNRVLMNLLDNSAKYKPNHHILVTIQLLKTPYGISLVVKDNGAGVLPEQLPNLFESFYRGDLSRNHPTDGSGLGLAIVKYIVEEHKGSIKAQNEQGLKITIHLPMCEEGDS